MYNDALLVFTILKVHVTMANRLFVNVFDGVNYWRK